MRTTIRASAPTRIDLAGGTLDIWPISVLVPGATTVNLAIEQRAEVTLVPRSDRRIRIASFDRRARAERELPLDRRACRGPLALALRLAASFAPERGFDMTLAARAPAGAGLGGSSTLAVAIAAALDRFTGARLGRARLLRRVMNVEAAEIGVPTGNQDYLAALHGGLSVWHHTPDGPRRERVVVPRGLAERLVLAYTGTPRQSGYSNWDMFRRFVESAPGAVRHMNAIARIAAELGDALRDGELETAGRLVGEEGRLRLGLAPTVSTPAIERASRAALGAGALGVKVCGAGGGGCLFAFAREGRARAVASAMAATGASILPVSIARRGLVLELSGRRAGSSPARARARRSRSRSRSRSR